MRKMVWSIATLCLLLASAVTAAEPLEHVAEMNDLAHWNVKRGQWTVVKNRFRANQDAELEYNDALPAGDWLHFKPTSGRRPRLYLDGFDVEVDVSPDATTLALGGPGASAETLDEFARGQANGEAVVTRAKAIDARLDELGSDPNFTEKAVRDGY